MDRFRLQSVYRTLVVTLACLLFSIASADATPPRYDHVVVVIMENETFTSVIGNRTNAPYINSLADGGVSFTRMRGVTHPSQPNYLELFSGDNQGITSDSTSTLQFNTPNLGASLRKAGFTFIAYADELPSAGDITTASTGSGYAVRHCPWVQWITTTTPLPNNKLPTVVHQPFTAFPTDFSQLPTVSFVIPSNWHNMHDFGVQSGDTWLQANLSNYAEWAKGNNSLLIVTWDEDAFLTDNLIPTVLYGAHLQNGTRNGGTWSLHNVLRTLEDMYALPHSGRAALVPPITGSFEGEKPVGTLIFATKTIATLVEGTSSTIFPGDVQVAGAVGTRRQALVRFENLFTTTGGPLPPNVPVLSAKLIAPTRTISTGVVNAHQMLIPWAGTATWNGTVAGISLDNVEAKTVPEFSAFPNYANTSVIFDATNVMTQWRSGAANYGWTLQAPGATAWTGTPTNLEVTVASGTAKLAEAAIRVVEGETARVKVSRTGDTAMPVSLSFTMSSITTATADYQKTDSGMITWAAGEGGDKYLDIPTFKDALVEGDETFQVRFTSGTLMPFEGPTTVIVTIADPPIDVWRMEKFGSRANDPDASDTADPDGDGVPNIFEFSRRSDPLQADAGDIATAIIGDYLTLSFTRNTAATDLSYTVQASGDLSTWLNGSSYNGTTSTPSNTATTEVSRVPSGTLERITVRDNVPASQNTRRFLRLQVYRN